MIPIARPWLGEDELEALRRPIESGWVTRGPEVEAFEREAAAAVGAEHACAVANGTIALVFALRAVGVRPGDEVVTVSYSFVATANAVRLLGAIPRFVDVCEGTYDIDPERVERAFTATTRAILCVHQLGMPCDLARLSELAKARGVALVEDAACALGSEVLIDGAWQRVGRPVGDAACFSFHPRKIVTTGEGGLVTTRDAAIDAEVRTLHHHGVDADGEHAILGVNARMSDLHAAVGRVQLTRLDAIVARRREQAARYGRLLASVGGVRLPVEPSSARSNWQSYAVVLDEGIDRDAVRVDMEQAGVATLGGIRCAHRAKTYTVEPWSCDGDRPRCGCAQGRCAGLAISERLEDHTVMVPIYHELSVEEQEQVAAALIEAVQRRTKR